MRRNREKHLFEEWCDKFDVQVQADRDGLMTFWQFAQVLGEVEHNFLTREGLRRFMEYTA